MAQWKTITFEWSHSRTTTNANTCGGRAVDKRLSSHCLNENQYGRYINIQANVCNKFSCHLVAIYYTIAILVYTYIVHKFQFRR